MTVREWFRKMRASDWDASPRHREVWVRDEDQPLRLAIVWDREHELVDEVRRVLPRDPVVPSVATVIGSMFALADDVPSRMDLTWFGFQVNDGRAGLPPDVMIGARYTADEWLARLRDQFDRTTWANAVSREARESSSLYPFGRRTY